MDSMDLLKYLMIGVAALFAVIVIVYLQLRKKMMGKNTKYVAQLTEGTKTSAFSMEIFYQKFYIQITRIPFLKRYALKLRRRLEIINLEDEYITRKQTAQIVLKGLIILVPLTIIIFLLTSDDIVLLFALLLFELFFVETYMEGHVDKIDNKLLKEQIDMFAEMRHAFHESNMVEEAVYDVAQNDELDVSRQAEKIYEILIADDPETELEKYYDIAPNSYLKEFAGISYLTKEFGDRKDKDGASLYLKNLNNITQEMQIEILKRDKLDYTFQSLSMIAIVPVLFINAIKSWAISQFSFTKSFYEGTGGFYVQVALLILTIICYILVRKLKDNGGANIAQNVENPWQAKLYKKPRVKKFVDLFIPKDGTREYRKVTTLLKESASKLKLEWFYINKLLVTVIAFIVGLLVFIIGHKMTVNYIYTNPTSDYDLMGSMTESEEEEAILVTEQDNKFIDEHIAETNLTQEIMVQYLTEDDLYLGVAEETIEEDAARILEKIQTIQGAYLKWYELLVACIVGLAFYNGPNWLLMFQKKMRQLEMENEVMQFQTIILMLMKIERVNVEMILEWLERYSNIFRDPISKCVNNYESGPWEALEELKNELAFPQMIRIVESLQAAVEQIPIREAFDELDTERAYYQEKRKESNEILISRKSMIGKVCGFAPMVVLFVGYLIVPLCLIGMTSMTEAFDQMSSMA